MTRPIVTIAALAALLTLSACGPGTPGATPPAETPTTDPTPTETDGGITAPPELPGDAVLALTAQLTADNGAALDLLMVVHQSTAWDDPTAADRPALMLAQCAGAYDESIFADQLFSFALIDVTATVTSGSWPSGAGTWLAPATDHLSVVSSGDVVADPDAESETPNCKRNRQLAGPGSGTMVVGFRGDTDAVGAAGGYTRWANHNYGFAVLTEGTFSSCTYEVTALGTEYGWDEAAIEHVDLPDICKAGNFFGEDDDS